MRRKMRTTYKPLTLEQLRSGDSCPICWEGYDKTCRVLPCSHVFHVHCIQQWFEQESTCPTCRYNLQADIQAGVSSGQSSATNSPTHGVTPENLPNISDIETTSNDDTS